MEGTREEGFQQTFHACRYEKNTFWNVQKKVKVEMMPSNWCKDCRYWDDITEYCELGKHEGVDKVMYDCGEEVEDYECLGYVPREG